MTNTQSRPVVIVTSRSFSSGSVNLVRRLEDAGLEVIRTSTGHELAQLTDPLSRAVAWIAGTAPVNSSHIALAPHLKILARYGVGTDAVDLAAAQSAGITITNTPGANSDAVAEHAVSLLLAGLRGIHAGDRRVRAGDWTVTRGRQLAGSVAGIVGFGRIGRGVAQRLSALGCQVLVHDPFVPAETIAAEGFRSVDLDTLRGEADVVSLHTPGGSTIVGTEWVGLAKPGQVIVNTARAGLVDEAAVAAGLRSGRLFAFAADTLNAESQESDASPLLSEDLSDRVVVTPHLGAQTTEAVDRMGSMAVDDVLAVLSGRSPAYPVPLVEAVSSTVGNRSVMRFVGVSTAQSSIMGVFPKWSERLGLHADLTGLDLPLDANAAQYRQAMRELRDDPTCRGALVTTHKIGVYEAASDLFAGFDDFAVACGEVSSVAVRDGRLYGAAKDPITAGLSLEEFLAPDHFRSGAELFCLGGGGAGTAIAWYLAQRADRPAAMRFVDPNRSRLDHLEAVVAQLGSDIPLHTYAPDEVDVQALLEKLPPRSLVVNATGLGKDRPGSPIPEGVVLPERGVVWELNYRGTLDFLRQAQAQQGERALTVVDGWRYFIHGWTQVIGEVFEIEMTAELVDELASLAEATR